MYKFEIAGLGIDKKTDHPLILMHSGEHDLILPIWIGPSEAQSIAISLQGEEPKRPLAHDLIISMVTKLHAAFDRIEVHTVRDGTFFTDVVLRSHNGEEIYIDSRPSDAIGIACRLDLPIMISDQVIEFATIPAVIHYMESDNESTTEKPPSSKENSIDMINFNDNLGNKDEFLSFLSQVKASDFSLNPQEE